MRAHSGICSETKEKPWSVPIVYRYCLRTRFYHGALIIPVNRFCDSHISHRTAGLVQLGVRPTPPHLRY